MDKMYGNLYMYFSSMSYKQIVILNVTFLNIWVNLTKPVKNISL